MKDHLFEIVGHLDRDGASQVPATVARAVARPTYVVHASEQGRDVAVCAAGCEALRVELRSRCG